MPEYVMFIASAKILAGERYNLLALNTTFCPSHTTPHPPTIKAPSKNKNQCLNR